MVARRQIAASVFPCLIFSYAGSRSNCPLKSMRPLQLAARSDKAPSRAHIVYSGRGSPGWDRKGERESKGDIETALYGFPLHFLAESLEKLPLQPDFPKARECVRRCRCRRRASAVDRSSPQRYSSPHGAELSLLREIAGKFSRSRRGGRRGRERERGVPRERRAADFPFFIRDIDWPRAREREHGDFQLAAAAAALPCLTCEGTRRERGETCGRAERSRP